MQGNDLPFFDTTEFQAIERPHVKDHGFEALSTTYCLLVLADVEAQSSESF